MGVNCWPISTSASGLPAHSRRSPGFDGGVQPPPGDVRGRVASSPSWRRPIANSGSRDIPGWEISASSMAKSMTTALVSRSVACEAEDGAGRDRKPLGVVDDHDFARSEARLVSKVKHAEANEESIRGGPVISPRVESPCVVPEEAATGRWSQGTVARLGATPPSRSGIFIFEISSDGGEGHPSPAGQLPQCVQQRRLADAYLTAEHESGTLPGVLGVVEERAERRELVHPVDQRHRAPRCRPGRRA